MGRLEVDVEVRVKNDATAPATEPKSPVSYRPNTFPPPVYLVLHCLMLRKARYRLNRSDHRMIWFTPYHIPPIYCPFGASGEKNTKAL